MRAWHRAPGKLRRPSWQPLRSHSSSADVGLAARRQCHADHDRFVLQAWMPLPGASWAAPTPSGTPQRRRRATGPEAHHRCRPDEPEPGEMNEGAAEQRDEQPVAARGARREHADRAPPRAAAIASTVITAAGRRCTTKKSAVCQVQAIQASSISGLRCEGQGRRTSIPCGREPAGGIRLPWRSEHIAARPDATSHEIAAGLPGRTILHADVAEPAITPSPGRSPWRCSCGRTRSRARRG